MKLSIVPCELSEANYFVEQYHRHHSPVVGHKFSLACYDGQKIVGVCIVGRPVSRHKDNSMTLEVTRLATDGTKNACSILYGGARRAAFALGYKRLITYTLPEEGGASLRASGWKLLGTAGGGTWNRKSRPRIDKHPTQKKFLWESSLEVADDNIGKEFLRRQIP